MKKIYKFIFIFISLLLVSCSTKLVAPTDLAVSNNVISFTEIDGAKHKAVILNKDTNKEYNRVIKNGATLDSLSLEPGLYEMYLEITLGNEIVQTEIITFAIEDLEAIKALLATETVQAEEVTE